jgi:Kef-type K+ transport system membrane component KefB
MEETLPELIYLGALMAIGFVAGDLIERLGIPRVAAYVAVGALFSETLLGRIIPGSPGVWSDALTNVTLAVIAFMVGAEMDIGRLRQFGRTVAATALGQALSAVALVALALWGLSTLFSDMFSHSVDWSTGLVFGVIATATAPAATLAVIEEYKAEGELTSMLLGIVAIDDAIGIVLFTIALGLVGEASFTDKLMTASSEILLALAAGAVLGAALGLFGRHIATGDPRLPVIVGIIILNFGLANWYDYSDLLSSIVLGLVAMIIFKRPQREWLDPMEHVRDTIFLIFFTLAGTHFDPSVFASALPLIVTYTIMRVIGKYAGAYGSAHLVGADEDVRWYLGLALLPQAGVAIGLALRASASPGFEEMRSVLLNTVIGSTIIFELSAPWLTKLALRRAGEIQS